MYLGTGVLCFHPVIDFPLGVRVKGKRLTVTMRLNDEPARRKPSDVPPILERNRLCFHEKRVATYALRETAAVIERHFQFIS